MKKRDGKVERGSARRQKEEVARRGSEKGSEGEGLLPEGLAPYVPNKQLSTYGKPHTYCKIQIYKCTLMICCGMV